MKKRERLFVICSFVLLGVLFFSACQILSESDDECDTRPSNCLESKPGMGTLEVSCTINSKNPSVPIAIYRGDFEKNDLVLRDTLSGSGKSYTVPTDQYYSVVAEYRRGNGDTVIAIDGDDVDFSRNDYCEGPCYESDPGEIDVRLLFPKVASEAGRTKFMTKARHY